MDRVLLVAEWRLANVRPVSRRRHPGALAKEVAEVMFVFEMQPLRDFFDSQPLIGQQDFGLLPPDLLQVFMDGFAQMLAKDRAKRRVVQTRAPGQFARANRERDSRRGRSTRG